MSPAEQLKVMKSRTEKFIGEAEILKRLEAGKTLRVKLGVDPTRPDLTFGHMVVFNKLRQFQELGHQAVLIIGDYTTRIGDPTGKRLQVMGMSHFHIKDGKVVDEWRVYDELSLMMQVRLAQMADRPGVA